MNGNSGQAASPAQANAVSRNAILNAAVDMWLPIYTATLTGTLPGQIVNIPVRNVGLIKRFLVKITGTFAQGAAETQTLTQMGMANTLSNVTFTDLSNQQRINTPGWHLHYLATARRQQAFGAAYTNDSPTGLGSNFGVIKSSGATVTTASAFTMYYEVPIAYGDYDLRGAIYANVVNATMNLQLTLNSNFSVGSSADPTLAVYQSSTGQVGVLSNVTIQVYQNFLDQLPAANGQVVLPMQDLATSYLLNQTSAAGLVVSQDNPISYSNFRNFMSTMILYDNSTGGGGNNAGTDINYLAIQSANYTNILKLDPVTVAMLTRQIIGDDMPKGLYYLDHRRKPISTVQYGNMQAIINPSTVNTGASFLVAWEALALQNQITQAGSLFGT